MIKATLEKRLNVKILANCNIMETLSTVKALDKLILVRFEFGGR